ncbi:MAG: hypothetical protein EOO77_46205, partial [Oxalobacteraceae bacterium]
MTGLISRLTQLRHSDHAIAASVRETLVGSLYASPQSLVIGAITSSGMMGVVALVSGSRSMILCAVAAPRRADRGHIPIASLTRIPATIRIATAHRIIDRLPLT